MDLSKLPIEVRQKIVVLAGVGENTLIYLKAAKKNNLINLNKINKKELEKQAEDSKLMGGDGTVPTISAIPYRNHIKTIGIVKESFLEELGNNINFHGLFMRDSRVQNILEKYILSKSNAANIANGKLVPLREKVANMWFPIADTVINLSNF